MFSMLSFLLPVALAVAASPVAVYGVTRMTLAGPPASIRPPAWGFLAGWLVGVLALGSVTALVIALLTSPLSGRAYVVVAGLLLFALGVLAWFVALRRWRARPLPGQPARWPEWAQGAGESDAARASGLGFALATLDLKNLVLVVSFGVYLALARDSFGTNVVALLVFALVSAAAILVVMLGHRFAGERFTAPLERLASGLELNLGGVEPVALLVVGGLLAGGVGMVF